MIILYNGVFYGAPHGTTALAIEDQRIFAAGSDDEILALSLPGSICTDLEGAFVLPGLTDSHIHLDLFGQSLSMVDCGTSTKAECLGRVASRSLETSEGSWIQGHGWNQNLWESGHGTALELDAVSPHRPVFLTDMSLHSAWVNSEALRRAGITRQTPDPAGGIIQRDIKGNPTGILFESAVNLVEKLIPPLTISERRRNLLMAQEKLLGYGITSVHDFDRAPCFAALQQLEAEGVLLIRVLKSLPVEELDEAIALGLRSGFGNGHLRIGSIKMFSDGALGPQTAALLKPYEGTSDSFGELMLSSDEVFDTGVHAAAGGLSLAIHAIGDRANREVLDGLKRLRAYEEKNNLPHMRHRVEHMQLLDAADLRQAAELDVCASMQPVHMYNDMYTAERHWGARSANAFPIHSLLDAATRVVFGSDAPVENPNPFWGIHAAVTRQRRDTPAGEPRWHPAECINLEDAIAAYTINPAMQAGSERLLGRLQPGYLADLVVLPRNPFQLAVEELHTLLPQRVMIGGDWVFQSP